MPEPVRRRALDLIAERVELAGKRIVDVGCGEGGLVRALVQRGASVTGVECGAEMLAAARAAEPAGDERYFFQITRLVEDEVEVRAAAVAAIRGACAAGLFVERAEIVYLNPVRLESFEAFAARMGRIDAARKAAVAEKEPVLRALFHRLAEARDGAFHFDQPARLTILARA